MIIITQSRLKSEKKKQIREAVEGFFLKKKFRTESPRRELQSEQKILKKTSILAFEIIV